MIDRITFPANAVGIHYAIQSVQVFASESESPSLPELSSRSATFLVVFLVSYIVTELRLRFFYILHHLTVSRCRHDVYDDIYGDSVLIFKQSRYFHCK